MVDVEIVISQVLRVSTMWGKSNLEKDGGTSKCSRSIRILYVYVYVRGTLFYVNDSSSLIMASYGEQYR